MFIFWPFTSDVGNYSMGVKSNCRLCFLNKVLLEHTHVIVYLLALRLRCKDILAVGSQERPQSHCKRSCLGLCASERSPVRVQGVTTVLLQGRVSPAKLLQLCSTEVLELWVGPLQWNNCVQLGESFPSKNVIIWLCSGSHRSCTAGFWMSHGTTNLTQETYWEGRLQGHGSSRGRSSSKLKRVQSLHTVSWTCVCVGGFPGSLGIGRISSLGHSHSQGVFLWLFSPHIICSFGSGREAVVTCRGP